MYDDCPDHGLPGLSVCASCVRPLCRKCKTKRSRCAECSAAVAKENAQPHPGRAAAGSGGLLLIVAVLCAVMLLTNWKGCPGMPRDIIWLK